VGPLTGLKTGHYICRLRCAADVPDDPGRRPFRVMRFLGGGGLCYNRWAVSDIGERETSPGALRGVVATRSEEDGGDVRPPQKAAITNDTRGCLEDVSRYCPVCSQRLESRRCKLVCGTCGYYMSCADYY
jgi:hypothetical protein